MAVGSPRHALPLAFYGGMAALSVGVAVASDRSPIAVVPWIPWPAFVGHVASIAVGIGLAFGTIHATRFLVRVWSSARTLHAVLRPAIQDTDDRTLALLGIAGAVSEELFFRGLLVPVFGLVASSIAFGLLHQVKGRAWWVWAGWAAVMGLLFGALFLATGSLLGPLIAHAAINVANLRFVRDTDVEPPKPRRLGGLLGRA